MPARAEAGSMAARPADGAHQPPRGLVGRPFQVDPRRCALVRFAVLYGSTRQARQGIGAARFMVRMLQQRGHQVDLLDACTIEMPFLDRMHKEFPDGEAPEWMEEVHRVLSAADGLVVVSAEYNHSVPPALKNLMDHFQPEYNFKAAGIVTYSTGPFAGQRVAPHWRAILGELGMYSCSIMFGVSKVGSAFETDGTAIEEAYERRVRRFLDELEWLTDALKAKRAQGTPW